MTNLAYLGPKGTFSEIAAEKFAKRLKGDVELVPYGSIEVVIERAKTDGIGVVPYSNFLEGRVERHLDLIYKNNLHIIDYERVLLLYCAGMHPEGTDDNKIRSHQKALDQITEWRMEKYPSYEQVAMPSTAAAAEFVRDNKSGIAVASEEAMKKNGLKIIDNDIGNKTPCGVKQLLS